jgi:hypothetical protein
MGTVAAHPRMYAEFQRRIGIHCAGDQPAELLYVAPLPVPLDTSPSPSKPLHPARSHAQRPIDQPTRPATVERHAKRTDERASAGRLGGLPQLFRLLVRA